VNFQVVDIHHLNRERIFADQPVAIFRGEDDARD
jgi:hypothetical protein